MDVPFQWLKKDNKKESVVTYVGDKFQQLAQITEKTVCVN